LKSFLNILVTLDCSNLSFEVPFSAILLYAFKVLRLIIGFDFDSIEFDLLFLSFDIVF